MPRRKAQIHAQNINQDLPTQNVRKTRGKSFNKPELEIQNEKNRIPVTAANNGNSKFQKNKSSKRKVNNLETGKKEICTNSCLTEQDKQEKEDTVKRKTVNDTGHISGHVKGELKLENESIKISQVPIKSEKILDRKRKSYDGVMSDSYHKTANDDFEMNSSELSKKIKVDLGQRSKSTTIKQKKKGRVKTENITNIIKDNNTQPIQKSKAEQMLELTENNKEPEDNDLNIPDKKKEVGVKKRKAIVIEGKLEKPSKTANNNKAKSKKRKAEKQIAEKIINENEFVEIISDSNSDEEKVEETKPKMIPNLDHHNSTLKSGIKHTVDMADVTSVLLMMEGKSKGITDPQPSTSIIHGSDEEEDSIEGTSEEEDSDWEEVEALPGNESPKKSQIPSGPIEITLDAPQIFKKRKKKQFDVQAFFQRQLNRFQKELREYIHKVHFMCLLSRGMFLNRLCCDSILQAQALSIIPSQFMSVSQKTFNINLLGRVLLWFKSIFLVVGNNNTNKLTVRQRLEESFSSSSAISDKDKALLLVILLRTLGLMTRLVMSLQPLPFKPNSSKASLKKSLKVKSRQSKCSPKNTSARKNEVQTSSKEISNKTDRKKSAKDKKKRDDTNESKYFSTKNKTLRIRGSKVKPKSYKDNDDEGDDDSDDEYIPSSDIEDDSEEAKKIKGKRKTVTSTKGQTVDSSLNSSDDDFEEESFTVRSPASLLRKSIEKSKNLKVVSSDSENDEYDGCDTWTEVFLESEDKWICIDCLNCKVERPHVIESYATKPVHYVFSFDNDGYIKDITPRYASKWLTDTRKLRTTDVWLEETVNPFKSPFTDNHSKEDFEIKASLVSKPLPSSIGEYKNHPLYVLKRHLLKFEAIYPNTAVPVGYLKNSEPVYARECVHVLHSRENWLKEGRAVRLGEEPYKMVKSRPRWNRKKENPDELDLETFGFWQTEVYIPPPAVDGKVPRNGYGNIELFMPSMLPAGTVHLKLPGLNKVAKKLNIDCVAAMTGWDNHSGYSHPVLDGFVVCEEFKDVLLAAWDEDQEIQKQREAEKREKRVIQNWQLLTKGLLIKDKLKRKYLLQSHLHVDQKVKDVPSKTEEKVDDYKTSWPMNKEGSESLSTAKHFQTETI